MSRFARLALNGCLALIALVLSGLGGLRAAAHERGERAPDAPAPATISVPVVALPPIDPVQPDLPMAEAVAALGVVPAPHLAPSAVLPLVGGPALPAPGCRRGAAGGPRAP